MFFKKKNGKPCIIVLQFTYGLDNNAHMLQRYNSPLIYFQGVPFNLATDYSCAHVFSSIKDAEKVFENLNTNLKNNGAFRGVAPRFNTNPAGVPINYSLHIMSPDLQEVYR